MAAVSQKKGSFNGQKEANNKESPNKTKLVCYILNYSFIGFQL